MASSEMRTTAGATSATTRPRGYHSPLRQAQADRTGELIVEALIDLLAERPSDEISTRDIARAAGVSERTVYRHFPDRRELHEALAERLLAQPPSIDEVDDLDELAVRVADAYMAFEANSRETIAAALLNVDPRRLASDTARRSARWVDLTGRTFPDLDERQRLGLAAVTRLLGSSQTWLRLREEFGIAGDESATLAQWAIGALVEQTRRGAPPFAE
jgi:AcrR family transcriptional regulator